MIHLHRLRPLWAGIFFVWIFCLGMFTSSATVLVAPIHGEITAGTTSQLQRVYLKAERNHVTAVILDLDTFGGQVDAATRIRDLIIAAPVPTVAYVHPRAWSAGALITLAAPEIIMSPGASLGSAEPIPTTEKTIAALRGEFAATAELRGRDAQLAAAMVDKNIDYAPYAPAGTILSLTESQAKDAGISRATLSNLGEVKQFYHWENENIETVLPNWADELAGFISLPWVRGLLVSIIFVSLLMEIKTAGFSGTTFITLFAGAILLVNHWQLGFSGWLEGLLMGGGFMIILADIFFVFSGLITALGILMLGSGLFLLLGANSLALYIIAGALIVAIFIFYYIAEHLPTGRLWRRIILRQSTDTESGYVAHEDMPVLAGMSGVALTPLRPAGTISVGEHRIDVVTQGEYIEAGEHVIVEAVIGGRVVVRRADSL